MCGASTCLVGRRVRVVACLVAWIARPAVAVAGLLWTWSAGFGLAGDEFRHDRRGGELDALS